MNTKQTVVESFDRDRVPHPHEPVHCETKLARPVCYLECKCGYAGFAHVIAGKPVCPAHLARVTQHERETNQTLAQPTVDVNSSAFQEAVNRAVAAALANQTKGGN